MREGHARQARRKGRWPHHCWRTSTSITSSTCGRTGGDSAKLGATSSSCAMPTTSSSASSTKADAERFLADMRQRMEKFALTLHPDKTRLIEFGRFAARTARRRGLGKPETFNFLGFTHICGRSGARRLPAQAEDAAGIGCEPSCEPSRKNCGDECIEPIPEQGRWWDRWSRGYFAYHAVPTNCQEPGGVPAPRDGPLATQRSGGAARRTGTTWDAHGSACG